MSTEILHQDLLGLPSPTLIQAFSAKQSPAAIKALNSLQSDVLGVSLHLVAGTVDAVAFATTEAALYITLRAASRSGRPPQSASFESALSSKTNVGFSMPHLALHLHRDHGWHIQALDLGSAIVAPGEKPLSPVKVLERANIHGIRNGKVHELWYPDTEDSSALKRTCLRAWISALYVEISSSTVASPLTSPKDVQTGVHSSYNALFLSTLQFWKTKCVSMFR